MVKGNLLDWVRHNLSESQEYSVLNGDLSDQAYVTSVVSQTFQSVNLRNLDFHVKSSQTMPHKSKDNF